MLWEGPREQNTVIMGPSYSCEQGVPQWDAVRL